MVADKNSIREYESKLQKLKENKIPLDGSFSVETIIDTLAIVGKSESTIKVYLCAILWELRKSKENNRNQQFINDLSDKITEINIKIKNELSKNLASEKQKNTYVDWDTISKIHSELKNKCNHSKKDFSNYVLFSLYVLFPPRRVIDYSEMHVVFGENNIVKNTLSDTFDNKNYYIYNKNKFVFNNFKTKKIYNKKTNKFMFRQQVFDITDELNNILKIYIDKYKINGSLFNISDKAMIFRIKKIFSIYTQKSPSVNNFRHSYIINEKNNKRLDTIEDMKKLAEKMGHSTELQMEYYKKDL